MKYRFSKAKKAEFAYEYELLNDFLGNHPEIKASLSLDSFYFEINGKSVRVSNHTIKASNRGAYDEFYNQIRKEYHVGDEYDIMITASKFRLPEIYKNLQAGKILDKRGNIK
jgi:hypothetical protein